MITKQCSECKQDKSLDQFTINKLGKHGRQAKCNPCRNSLDRAYRKANRPTTKVCLHCKKRKSVSRSFNSQFSKLCKPCKVVRTQERKDSNKNYQKTWHSNRSLKIKQFIFNYLSTKSCIKCGVSDVLVLEFDHKNPKRKSFNLGKAFMDKDMTINKLKKEIAKCVVLCSNCHTHKTHEQNNSWRYQMATGILPKESI